MFIHVHIYVSYVCTYIMLVSYCTYLHTNTIIYSQQNRHCISLITCTFFIVILLYIVCNVYVYIQIKTFLLSPVNVNKLLCTLCFFLHTIRRMGTDQICYAFCVFSIFNIKFCIHMKWVDA